MIWLTWRQFRMQAIVAVIALVAAAIALAITGTQLAHLYDTTVANCAAQHDCPAATVAFNSSDGFLKGVLGLVLLAVPAVLGMFWGASLIAREFEAGTYRLAWTQSVTRQRWLVTKLVMVGLASMAAAGLFSWMVTWWYSPMDRVQLTRFNPGVFDERGIVAIGYGAFAFALGVTAAVLIRRTIPAMAASLAVFIGGRIAMAMLVRPHLMPPHHTTLPVTSGNNLGFLMTPTGVVFDAGQAVIANAWVLSSHLVDKSGSIPTAAAIHQFVATACPKIATPSLDAVGGHFGPGDPTVFHDCLAQVATKFDLVSTYQPASRYWTFQAIETAIFIGLAIVLSGLCVWWVRRRLG